MNPAFVTGSYAYGTPTPESDIDLVILCNKETLSLLDEHFRPHNPSNNPSVDESLRVGKLNIITCTTQAEYDHWQLGTQELIAKKPVSRKDAIEHFLKLRGRLRTKKK